MDMKRVQEEIGIKLGLEHMSPAVVGWLEELGATDEESLWAIHKKYCVTVDMLPPSNFPRGGAAQARIPKTMMALANPNVASRDRDVVHPGRDTLSILEVV
jgi:hypothetical protein